MSNLLNGESTPQTFKEEWVVISGKETFVLDERQVGILKTASLEGSKRLVWFKDFAISIPHIQAIYCTRRYQPDQLTLSKGNITPELSDEELLKAREKADKVRKQLAEKLNWKK
jgi:hypothetical protein